MKSVALILWEDVVFGICVVKEVTRQFEVWLIARRKRRTDGRVPTTAGVPNIVTFVHQHTTIRLYVSSKLQMAKLRNETALSTKSILTSVHHT